jgi:hypothetical protein
MTAWLKRSWWLVLAAALVIATGLLLRTRSRMAGGAARRHPRERLNARRSLRPDASTEPAPRPGVGSKTVGGRRGRAQGQMSPTV